MSKNKKILETTSKEERAYTKRVRISTEHKHWFPGRGWNLEDGGVN